MTSVAGISKLMMIGLLAVSIGAISAHSTFAADNGFSNWKGFPFLIKNKRESQPVQLAQSNDAAFRVNQLEEQVRQLNGQVEELNFQLLQIQEMMRRMQEDNEFRFQELEGKKSGSLNSDRKTKIVTRAKKDKTRLGKSLPSDVVVNDSNSDVKKKRKPRMIDGVEIYEGDFSKNKAGEKESPLGSITFDAMGNIIDSTVGKPIDLTARTPSSGDQIVEDPEQILLAKIEDAGSDKDLYNLGYGFFQKGHFVKSERVFRVFSEQYPDSRKMPKAQLWLGESLYAQQKYESAAKVFLDAHNRYPDARIAPQILLKLGQSLAGMEQRELACATYAKVFNKYPGINDTLKKRVGEEQRSSRCLNG